MGTTDPDAGQPGWNVTLYAVWAGQLLALIGFSSRAPFLPFYLGDLGVTDVAGQALWSGAINAAGAGAMALTAPIWGLLADRYGRKPMLLRGLFGGAVTVALMGFAIAPWQLLALRMLEGALTGTVAAATALVATSAPAAASRLRARHGADGRLRRRLGRAALRRHRLRPHRPPRHLRAGRGDALLRRRRRRALRPRALHPRGDGTP